MNNETKAPEYLGVKPISPQAVYEAYSFYFMPQESRLLLKRAIDVGLNDYGFLQGVSSVLETSREMTANKLSEIGLTVPEYLQAYEALKSGDVETVTKLAIQAKLRMTETNNISSRQTTKDKYFDSVRGVYDPLRMVLHNQIVEERIFDAEGSVPLKLILLVGSPASGKSYLRDKYVDNQTGMIATDPDLIRGKLLPGFNQSSNRDVLLVQEEAFDVSEKVLDKLTSSKLDIICETAMSHLDWWVPKIKQAKGYDIELVFLYSTLDQCLRRSVAMRDRAVPLGFLLSSIQSYSNFLLASEMEEISRIKVIDNSDPMIPSLVFEKKDGIVILEREEELAEIRNYVNKYKQIVN